MKTQKTQINLTRIAMIMAVIVITSCATSESDKTLTQVPSESFNEDPQSDPLNIMVSEFLGFDSEQSMLELQEVDPWVEENIELDDSTASMHLPNILGAKAVAFYTYDDLNDGWRQFLLVANHENFLTLLEGDLIDLEGMEYELMEGKKKPKKTKHPKPIKGKYGKRRGCEVWECSDGGLCVQVTYIPCAGHKSTCTSDSDCDGQSHGVGSDELVGEILSY